MPANATVNVFIDCAQLISRWSCVIASPFSSRLLKEDNHLIWLTIRDLIYQRNLSVKLIKVPAHANNTFNSRADEMAKSAHSPLQPSSAPLSEILI